MTDAEKKELEFAHTEAANAIQRYFEISAEKRGLLSKIATLEVEKDKAVEKARRDMASDIFREMYSLIKDAVDETIIVTADDVRSIAKRYGVRL